MPITIDQAQPGVKVILGEHANIPGVGKYWCSQMDSWIGKVATLKNEFIHKKGCFSRADKCCYFDVEENDFHWRIENMQLASNPIEANGAGATCKQCQSFNPYVDANPDYVCAICKGWQKAWS